jgi:predicted nucleic acid-binding protein
VRDVLVDAGALIALLDEDDDAHERCVEALKAITAPLVTVWPALTEAMHLLGRHPRAQGALCDMIDDGAVRLADLTSFDFPRLKGLMVKYADLPMDFADAALVCVAERDGLREIVTFDRHFEVYALPRRTRFVIRPKRTRPSSPI